MVEAIHTAVPGRARYKVTGLYRSASLGKLLEQQLTHTDGISHVSANPLTGTVLVLFNVDENVANITTLIEGVVRAQGRASGDQSFPPSSSVVRGESKGKDDGLGSGSRPHERTATSPSRRTVRKLVTQCAVQKGQPWHLLTAGEVLASWQTSPTTGLLSVSAQERLQTYGPNVLPESVPRSELSIFLDQLQSLPVALLTAAAGISLFTGGLTDALVILGVVAINATIGYVTESQSEKTMPLTITDPSLADRVNMIYMGTLVTGGQGLAVVVATGRFTEIGKIQTLVGEAQAPETPMERQLDRLGTQLVVLSGGVCALVFGIGVLRGYGLLEMLKSAISLAVAAVPEGLPTVATTTLALGIANMRKHHVLIRRLDAVETLGCVQTICLDKTGTLTLNKMTVVAAYVGMRRLQIVDDHFRMEAEPINAWAGEELVKLAQVCVLCSETEIERQNGHYVLQGSPTENALIYMAISVGVDICQLREAYPIEQLTLRAEDRNFMRTIHRAPPDSPNGVPASLFVAVKGSPAEVLAMCTWHSKNGERLLLTEEDRLRIETENEQMAGEALRILGTAYRCVEEDKTESDLHNGLTWLGLIGMADPVRVGVKDVIAAFHRAGIDTVMITGDQSPTAYAIGKELLLSRNGPLEILDSTHLTNIDPLVMTALAEKVHVFARVSPAYKLQIVQALQQAGKVVAMTGDGINDGPALKAADIGIAMGDTGTDVAREVADVVLEDDNLETMIVAISQGRTIYSNIRKSVHFLLSTNLSEIMVTFTAITGGLGQPLNAMQLLWINLLSDIFPSLALALEPPEPDVLNRPPRSPEDPIIKTSDFQRIAFEATTLSAGALGAYGYGLLRYGTGPQASTLAFSGLTAGQLLHSLTSRSETHTIFDETKRPANPYLNAALIGSLGLQALTLIAPGLRSLLGLTPITLMDGLMIGASALLPFAVNETTKEMRLPDRNHQGAETTPCLRAGGSTLVPALER